MAAVDYGTGTKEIDPADIEAQIRAASQAAGVTYDPSDTAGYFRNISYDQGGGDSDKTLQSILDRIDTRSNNTPGVGDSNGGPDTRVAPGASIADYGARDAGAASTGNQMDEILRAITGMNTSPDVPNPPAIDPAAFTVPGEDLSPAIDNTLLDLMEGQDPFGLTDRIQSLLDSTAGGGVNSARLQTRNEQAREQLTRGSSAALADMRGVLADRGLMGAHGAPEGAELDSTVRTLEPLQRSYLDELRTSNADESTKADEAERSALETATGWSRDQIDRRLSAATTATARQQMVSQIALDTLGKNIEWNKFIAQFGLDREKLQADIQQGRMDAILPVLQMFQGLLSQSRGGYI